MTGELIFSGRLLRAFAAAGADTDVVCHAGRDGTVCSTSACADVRWHFVPRNDYQRWRSVLSPLPNIAARCATPAMRQRLEELLMSHSWDAVVLDSLSAGWAFETLRRRLTGTGRRPRIVHVSHNHEETTRADVARSYRGNPAIKAALRADAYKIRRLERFIADEVDLLTAITPEDGARFSARRNDSPTIVVTPGYAGRRVERRRISKDTPRRAIFVGTFGWIAKQMNLEEFLKAAVPAFERAGVELQVIGTGDPGFIRAMRQRFPSIDMTGPVDDVYPFMDQARIAVVPERCGGGFKLKLLDYVFNRLPIAMLDSAAAGVPLNAGRDFLGFADPESLARGIVSAIDDIQLLNLLQERAFAACDGQFEWSDRGRTLMSAVSAL